MPCNCNSCGGGCGSSGCPGRDPVKLCANESALLIMLGEVSFLPLARFSIVRARDHEFSVSTGPVYLPEEATDQQTLSAITEALMSLEEKGLISLDYDMPLNNYDYKSYLECPLHKSCIETATEAKARGFGFDTPFVELGSFALTAAGQNALDDLEKQ